MAIATGLFLGPIATGLDYLLLQMPLQCLACNLASFTLYLHQAESITRIGSSSVKGSENHKIWNCQLFLAWMIACLYI